MGLGGKILKYTAYAAANFVGAFVLTTVVGAHISLARGRSKPDALDEIEGYPIKNIDLETVDGVPLSLIHI